MKQRIREQLRWRSYERKYMTMHNIEKKAPVVFHLLFIATSALSFTTTAWCFHCYIKEIGKDIERGKEMNKE